ncbi:hypothetical protein Syn7803C17_108 [Synechococcus phage ACG-2014f]|uniref:HNH nuclease domain-containing protein n=2 Tax=Synechococcus phage ACG-2014f TaxID=1493511 RepID=A0A0E3I148_9CAUD|nr:endonuclease [Synechococcus phage ACG-2014f]AIX21725.1 hypothetical protein Syn7803C90_114 [Synechococcus phage ACG-2014f]AIX27751.1 hypothetical protein Syn7803US17_110 [Synechococcus phage ACG-2014f]AIX42612.1 hypothetical protein Syn7803C17_108 [Synechococcus phage ACG-2014f]
MSPKNVLERLIINSVGETDEECWETTLKSGGGFGHTRIRLDDGTRMMVHRLSWEAHNAEPIPDGMLVLHKCDNPKCFNPHHLFLGTQTDNMRDKVDKGRANFYSKLTPEQRVLIRHSTEDNKTLSRKFGVTTARIRQLKQGR